MGLDGETNQARDDKGTLLGLTDMEEIGSSDGREAIGDIRSMEILINSEKYGLGK
ncbi:hypothetical protein IQB77_22695, partial [Leptospira interrogans serovar Pomona]|nr:hypothetical protein [Leptospira interrogans serovar Pomona]